MGCTKASALFFYKRIFCPNGLEKTFNRVILATVGVVVIYVILFGLLTGFQCGTHFSALFNGDYLHYCFSFQFLLAVSVTGVLLDTWILALPMPKVCTLED